MKKQDLLIILIPTFICVISWIGFNIYHNSITSTISSQDINQITPINPNFDTKIIDVLKKRESVEPFYQNATPTSSFVPTPTPQVLPIVSSSKSAKTTGGTTNQ